MKTCEIQDGTWTLRVSAHRGGAWRTTILEPWVADCRFREARFELVGGPTILVAAEDLRQVVAQTVVRGHIACPIRIDPKASTINSKKVDFRIQA
jgi:hypothetical protein